MKKLLITILVILFATAMLWSREKVVKIGHTHWYTEANSFEEMKQIARKENKPILAVFSATWNGPCQILKESVFEKEGFKKITDEAVLLFIEQMEEEGEWYIKKYKINVYPSFRVFSPDGTILDRHAFPWKVESFIENLKKILNKTMHS